MSYIDCALSAESQGQQNAGATEDAMIASRPVVCLPDNAGPAMQQNMYRDGRHDVSVSPAAHQHLTDAQQQRWQQPILGSSIPRGWSGHGEGLICQSVSTQPIHPADPQDIPPHLLLSDEPLSPNTLASMFDMPALSFDTSQHHCEDEALATTPQSQPKQAVDYQIHANDQQPTRGSFDSGPFTDLQHHHQPLWSSSSMGDLQWADACPASMNLPNVIRKTSSDSTIE